MGLIIPTRRDVVAALQSYVRSFLPELDPSTRRRGFIGGMVKSFGSNVHDFYVALKRYGDNEPFPQNASRPFLFGGWWNDITKLKPLASSPAHGKIVLTGTHGVVIPTDMRLSANNVDYVVDTSVSIVTQSLTASSLVRMGATAVFETASPHYLATGMELQISGATQSEYNKLARIVVTADNEFIYDLAGDTPSTPATGTIKVSGEWAVANVTATTPGTGTNVDSGNTLTVTNGPVGIDATAIVGFGGIAGGTEDETTDAFRKRTIEALGTDFGMFSADEIKIVAKTIPGVTRVWVREATIGATNGVAEGQVKIAFVRDLDANPFPSSQEVADVKAVIVNNIMPAHTDEEDVMVMSPTELVVNFAFASITPNTASMRIAVKASLAQFFSEAVDYATGITEDAYRCAIFNTYDREGKATLKAFTLTSPSGDIVVGENDLPRLGTVTFT